MAAINTRGATLPGWATWAAPPDVPPYTLGVEEEVMLVEPQGWTLASRVDDVLPALSPELAARAKPEVHGSVLELSTGVHTSVANAAQELRLLRAGLEEAVAAFGLRVAASGTHPFALWQDTVISAGERYEELYGSMRELVRREPTFAVHVHVGVPDGDAGIRLVNRLRGHLPLILALSVNSPFWQGRDTGLGSARTPLFGAFPRTGTPRRFRDYAEWAETVDLLIRSEAIPEPTFLWWDIRPQPSLGTVEIRIPDAQTTADETVALVALVQSVARLELEEGYASELLLDRAELLEENRFLAARDGVDARLIDPVAEQRVPVARQVRDLIAACAPHAQDLGCERELRWIEELAERSGAHRQVAVAAEEDGLSGLVARLGDAFTAAGDGGAMARLQPSR